DPAVAAALGAALARSAGGPISAVHDVRMRETARGYIVNYRAQAYPAVSVQTAYDAIEEIERRARQEFPTIWRIVARIQPEGP
ncbi:cation transporter dimerization domain-containing protein, partial [Methylocystis sp. 9N]